MSIFGAVLAKVLADRKGLPPDVSNRFLVTGYAIGSVTSPIISAVVSERLAQQEADKLATAPTPISPTPSPGTEQPPAPTTAIRAENYRGRTYSEVEKELTDQNIKVIPLNVRTPKSDYGKGKIVDQYKLNRDPLEEGTLLIPGDTVVFAVKSDEKQVEVPPVEGKTPEEAKKEIEAKGFIFAQEEEVRAQKWLGDGIWAQMTEKSGAIVFDQEPEAGSKEPVGSTVTVFVLPKKERPPAPGLK